MLDVAQQQETGKQSTASKSKQSSPKPGYGSVKEYSPPKAAGDPPSNAITQEPPQSEKDISATDQNTKAEVHRIPTSQTNLIIANAGYDAVNGEYRWFVHSSKWCLFREADSYSMENGVSVDDIYRQLSNAPNCEHSDFRWPDEVDKCWTITNLDGSVIYYAAPHLQTKESAQYIPSDKGEWIAVHGTSPSPNIYPDTTKESTPPSNDEPFGNAAEKEENGCKPTLQPIAESEDQSTENVKEQDKEEEEEEDDESLSDISDME